MADENVERPSSLSPWRGFFLIWHQRNWFQMNIPFRFLIKDALFYWIIRKHRRIADSWQNSLMVFGVSVERHGRLSWLFSRMNCIVDLAQIGSIRNFFEFGHLANLILPVIAALMIELNCWPRLQFPLGAQIIIARMEVESMVCRSTNLCIGCST